MDRPRLGSNDLTANIAAFCGALRVDHGFSIGQAEAHDALRALAAVGVADETRVRAALRLICCARRDERLVFDRAFDRFFGQSMAGVAQPVYQARRSRTGHPQAAARTQAHNARPPNGAGDARADTSRRNGRADPDEASGAATAWQLLRARYSPTSASAPLEFPVDVSAPMLAAANALVSAVRRGRSRRWKPAHRGSRLDLRRTLRASLQTGGDLVTLRFAGHPPRNPRFVMLIDGSRSMSDHTAATLGFASALLSCSLRAHVFVFSTELREVTRDLRSHAARPAEVGAAWGGGTRIGLNLRAFVARYAPSVLNDDTLVIVCSDGLDVGDVRALDDALRAIDRRCAGIVWLNPHAARADFVPSARGMHAALAHITLLTSANDAPGFARLARSVARNARLRGQRG